MFDELFRFVATLKDSHLDLKPCQSAFGQEACNLGRSTGGAFTVDFEKILMPNVQSHGRAIVQQRQLAHQDL